MKDDQKTLIKKLDKLLDAERQALLDGKLEKLHDLVDEKEALIDALNKLEFSQDFPVSEINGKVQRNQALLEQALSGIRSVALKLANLREARKSLDTYDQRGQKNRIEPGDKSSVEKRA